MSRFNYEILKQSGNSCMCIFNTKKEALKFIEKVSFKNHYQEVKIKYRGKKWYVYIEKWYVYIGRVLI